MKIGFGFNWSWQNDEMLGFKLELYPYIGETHFNLISQDFKVLE